MKVSKKGVDFIKGFEGLYLEAYECPASGKGGNPRFWTIGYGTTVYPNGSVVKPGDACTEKEAEDFLENDLIKYGDFVRTSVAYRHIDRQGQFDALVSFVYNVGKGGVHPPNSIDRRLRNGEDFEKVIREELPRWNKGGGRVLPGLVRRRKEELEMFMEAGDNVTGVIEYGEVSEDVAKFQKMLNVWLAFWDKEEIVEDGHFGPNTLDALNDFQRNNKEEVSNFVSRNVWNLVESFYKEQEETGEEPEGFYRWVRGQGEQLTKNFHASEFECSCGCRNQKISKKLLWRLQKLREELGRGVRVNSGYRCWEYNRRINGAKNSRHVVGDAADLYVSSLSPSKVADVYEGMFGGDSGIGRYSTFTHVDTRGYPARW